MRRSLIVILLISLFLPFPLRAATTDPRPPAVTIRDHILGRRNAPLTLVVYSDLQCPFCAKNNTTVLSLLRKYHGKLNTTYRHYPLAFHPYAEPAARAAECVAKIRGNASFWAFINTVFAKGAESYATLGETISGMPVAFQACMEKKETESIVLTQQTGARSIVSGTPTSFLIDRKSRNVKMISGAQPQKTFEDAIDAFLRGDFSPPTPAPALSPTPAPTATGSTFSRVSAADHVRGSAQATVSLVEYVDFECPFCKKNHETMQRLLDTYPGKVRWVLRQFPLSFHPNAQHASEASECVAELGGNDAFWTFSDSLFSVTNGLSASQLPPLAAAAGVGESAFTGCLESGRYTQNVQTQADAGKTAGVRGTPMTFLLDERTGTVQELSGAQPFETFQNAVDAILAR